MNFFIIIFLCFVIQCSSNPLGFLANFFLVNSVTPERVRTVNEYNRRSNESVLLDFIGLIEQYDGYEAEEYNITTEDGYILGLHRISGSPLYPKSKDKKVVYLQHGLFGSSDFLVFLGPNLSLPFYLADAGYDVWLGNLRGNVYSKSHVSYKSDSFSFWNFRMDEMADKDISKFIDFIIEKTNQTKLSYIGYSMGTTLIYMLLSSKPEYNDKIDLLVSLAPVAYFSSPSNFVIDTMISGILVTSLVKNNDEILPQSVALSKLAKKSCNDSDSNPCKLFLSHFANDIYNLSEIQVQQILSYTPAGTSYYTVEHYQQLRNSNRKFQKFDYNTKWYTSNMAKYNQTEPPQYNVSLISVPHVIMYSQSDVFVSEKDTIYLKNKFNNVVAFEEVSDNKFNHIDFIWSTRAKNLVYEPLLKLMLKYV